MPDKRNRIIVKENAVDREDGWKYYINRKGDIYKLPSLGKKKEKKAKKEKKGKDEDDE
jgi:hypothetical protein